MIRMLLLVFVLGAVWYLWKLITEQKAAAEAKDAAEADPATPAAEEAANTAECPLCKAYVSINAEGGCGREECPIPELAAVAAEEAEQAKAEEAKKP
jgi:zona occludens toxin (predicted ATPase)